MICNFDRTSFLCSGYLAVAGRDMVFCSLFSPYITVTLRRWAMAVYELLMRRSLRDSLNVGISLSRLPIPMGVPHTHYLYWDSLYDGFIHDTYTSHMESRIESLHN